MYYLNCKCTCVSEWPQFFYDKLKEWTSFYQHWLCDFTRPLHPVLYENLRNDTYLELKRLFAFLHLKVKEKSLLCAVHNQEGNFHRKKTESKSKNETFHFLESVFANVTVATGKVARCLYSKYGITWNYFSVPDMLGIHS